MELCTFNILAYADDIVLINENINEIKLLAGQLLHGTRHTDLYKFRKTKYFIIAHYSDASVQDQNIMIISKKVHEFITFLVYS